ncbi:MAG: polysaccharide biosynthesis protein [Lachnospiraceae bacterium]
MGIQMRSDLKQLWIRRAFLLILDVLSISAAGFMALLVRFDLSIGNIDAVYEGRFLSYLPIHIVVVVLVFWIFRMYNSLWAYASIEEMLNIMVACIVAEVLHLAGMSLYYSQVEWGWVMPRSFWPMELIFLMILSGATRFFYRFLRRVNNLYRTDSKNRIMVVGAGEAANAIIREIIVSKYLDGKVVCVIDDDKKKYHSYIQGVKIVGDRKSIPWAVDKYGITDIFIAIPSLPRKELKNIIDYCNETPCRIKALPSMTQVINEDVSISRLKDVKIEDLLGRDSVELHTDNVMGYVKNKAIMVTGGGGSIGSELCRQIAKHGPKQLIIIEIYENNAYDIEQELRVTYPELDLVVLIASIRNTNRMKQIFETYHPELVYHAAAHKHVPLMEASPSEAIKNNVYGTLKLARMCDQYHVKRMVQISTDKAVNPTNVMGASKRMCEMIIQAYNNRSETEFVAVRFGNVLGSNGSVIPLFKKQIAAGGPVTVTDPRIIRYFMTIPEAVSLVLEAGAIAKGGEIFVLDMGEPVRIDDMARNLIRLSGYVPDRDIEIVYTGLRPGEKLYEELLMDEEGLEDTDNELIHIGKPIEFDEEAYLKKLDEMYEPIMKETVDIRAFVKEMVPTYHPDRCEANKP